jgi:phosphate transport system protein
MMDQARKQHMLGVFKGPLLKIKDSLLMMASLTDRNMTLALNAYLKRDDSKASIVESEDEVIDRLEIDIDELVITYVSTHAPIATIVEACIHTLLICRSIERAADHTKHIAEEVVFLYTAQDIRHRGAVH